MLISMRGVGKGKILVICDYFGMDQSFMTYNFKKKKRDYLRSSKEKDSKSFVTIDLLLKKYLGYKFPLVILSQNRLYKAIL